VSFSCVMTLSDLSKYSTTRSIARSLCETATTEFLLFWVYIFGHRLFIFSFIRTYFCSRLELTKHSSSDETSLPRDGTHACERMLGPDHDFDEMHKLRAARFCTSWFRVVVHARAREFHGSGRLFCTMYGWGATGRQTCAIFGFWPLSEVHAPHRVPF